MRHRVDQTPAAAKPSKYHAVKTTVDNIVFASKKEARRYGELKLLEKVGEIYQLALQPKFELRVPVLTVGARLSRVAARLRGESTDSVPPVLLGTYIADFSYRLRQTDKRIVEDVKGFKTPLYRWKKKHVEAQYGIQIREV